MEFTAKVRKKEFLKKIRTITEKNSKTLNFKNYYRKTLKHSVLKKKKSYNIFSILSELMKEKGTPTKIGLLYSRSLFVRGGS